jgi:probable F420-dependent oxidoreductase
MRIGVSFPQNEIGTDPVLVRDYAHAAEDLGYCHLAALEHVAGAHPEGRVEGWAGYYTHKSLFHEPMVLFGYIAAQTQRIQLITSVLVLPLRQTVLVAKQAAEVDVLSGGRLRLGVSVGWNPYEYEAMGQDFHNRGRRIEEQIEVLRLLWTQEIVDFKGKWHRIDRLGINPLPIQRPIPIWMGGQSEAVLKRIARLADGWFPQLRPGVGPYVRPGSKESLADLDRLKEYIRLAGRQPSDVSISGSLTIGSGTPKEWSMSLDAWRDLGATHITVSSVGGGLTSPRQHIEAIRRFKELLPNAGEFAS